MLGARCAIRQAAPVDVFDAMATTRAIRRYQDEDIPDEHLGQMFWAASRAASGSNRQPFRFVVLRRGTNATEASLDARRLIGGAFARGWAAKLVADGYVELPPGSPKARMAATMQHFVDHVHEAPVIVLACLARYREPQPTEGGSVYPAVQNLLLAARSLGYGGVITMWHGAIEAELKSVLSIPEHVAIHAVIPLGRPIGAHGPVRRRPLRELVYENEWTSEASWAIDPPGTPFAQAGPRPATTR
jgi:nitroreductase